MIHLGDLFDVLPTLAADSIDACVTDPPYDLTSGKRGGSGAASLNLASPAGRSRITTGGGFMGKKWDGTGVAFRVETWREVMRVMKPGAYLVAFGGTRTFHRMTCAIEDAGFEIRDCLSFLHGQGFPKSLDVSKAIDKAAGQLSARGKGFNAAGIGESNGGSEFRSDHPNYKPYEPITEAAKQWDGWGTALKPGWEPIMLARKPLKGTVAGNVETFGTGALNIDACRIETSDVYSYPNGPGGKSIHYSSSKRGGEVRPNPAQSHALGRWPANVILDEAAAVMLDEQTGVLPAGVAVQRNRDGLIHNSVYGGMRKPAAPDVGYGDPGGASRFFYVAKPDRAERDHGTEHLVARARDESRKDGNPGGDNPRNRGLQPRGNSHPTVKPIALMRWLVRLVTPPGGTVLDPFLGSGTTAIACRLEGREWIGIEREADYIQIAEARIAATLPLFSETAV